jgi:hypothetical protein
MSDIDDVENAWLEGNAFFEKFISEDERDFFAPVERRLMQMTFATITDQEKKILEKVIPDAFASVEEQVQGMEGRNA